MSTNLEKKSFDLSVRQMNEKMELSIDIIDKKFNDAMKIVSNFKSKIESEITESDIDNKTTEIVGKITDKNNMIDQLRNHFISSSISVDDVQNLANKYLDNKDKIAAIAENTNSTPEGAFVDDGEVIYGNNHTTSSVVTNESFETLTGVNAMVNDVPKMAKGFISNTGHSRTVYLTMFDNQNIIAADDLRLQQPFTKEYNNVRNFDNKPDQSTPFIIIERLNKVHSFDFGIQYVTKAETIKCYVKDGNGAVLIDTAIHTNSSAFTKRYHGSIILEDNGETISSSYILNNTDKPLFDGQIPEFEFRLSFDSQYIYLYLEKVIPCKIIYSEVETESVSKLFVRDILESIINEDTDTTTEDTVLSIKNKYGLRKEFFGIDLDSTTRALLSVLNPFSNFIEEIENIYLIPNYMVNLSLKDNSFHIKDTFTVGQMFERSDILNFPYSLIKIKPSSINMKQLEGIPLTDGNNLPIISSPNKSIFSESNIIFSTDSKKFVKKCSLIDLIKNASTFIKDHYLDEQPVFYTLRAQITTTLNDGLKVDINGIPDYVIDEVGKYVKNGDTDCFFCVFYITHTKTNETISISNDKELRDFITKTPILFNYLSSIDNSNPVYETSDIKLPLRGNTFGKIPHNNALHIIYNPLFGINPGDDFKGLSKIDVKILPDMYDYENLILKHITKTDNELKFGTTPSRFPNAEELPNQVMIDTVSALEYKNVTVVGYENCVLEPIDTDITVVYGSDVVYTITPKFLYKIDRVLVNGIITPLTDNKIYVRDIRIDTVITIETSMRALININVTSQNCLSINPSISPISIHENENVTFTVTPIEGYRLTSATANGVAVDYIKDNVFTLHNVMVNTNLEIFCTAIPKTEYVFNISNIPNCTITPAPGQIIVHEGDSLEVIVEPNADYQITRYGINGALFTIDGVVLEEGLTFPTSGITFLSNKVQFTNIKENINFTPDISQIPLDVYNFIVNGQNCSIYPNDGIPGGLNFVEGDNVEFTITVNQGYQIDTILINGVELINGDEVPGVTRDGNKITFTSIQSDGVLEVICLPIPPTKYLIDINIPQDSLFTIHNPDGNTDDLEYNENTTPTFSIIPNSGYYVTSILINGTPIVTNNTTYTFLPLQSAMSISATVELIPPTMYAINISRSNNCSVVVSPSQLVNAGENVTITITPSDYHYIEIVKINGVIQNPINNLIEISNIDMNYDIYVSAKPRYISITPIGGSNYSIFPAVVTPVQQGTNQVFEITPDEGYIVNSIIVTTNGVDTVYTDGRFYLFENVMEEHSIRATVVKRTFLITPLSDIGYNVSPNLPVIVEYNDNSPEFAFTPETGRYIERIFEGEDEVYVNNDNVYEPLPDFDLSLLTIKHIILNVKKSNYVKATTKSFLERSFSVQINANTDHCTLIPGEFTVVGKGTSLAVTITAKDGFRIKQILVNGIIRELYGNDLIYYENFVEIVNDKVITVVTEERPPVIYDVIHGPNTFCKTTCLNPDIELNPLGATSNPVKVYKDGSLVFKASPLSYLYKIVRFIINEVTNVETTGYGDKEITLPNINDNMRLSAIAELIIHRLTLIEAIECSVVHFDGNGDFVDVNHNTNYLLQFVPSVDFELDVLTINDQPMTTMGNTFLITNILEPKNIFVRYIPKLYITLHTGIHCKYNVYLSGASLAELAVNGFWRMSRGTNYFKIVTIPDEGYEVDKSYISDPTITEPDVGNVKYQEVLTNKTEIIFNNIQINKGWYSECKKKKFNIIVVQSPNCEIKYDGSLVSSVEVEYGDSITFDITPNTGYKISVLRINGIVTPFPPSLTSAGGTYSFDNISTSRSINVTAELDV